MFKVYVEVADICFVLLSVSENLGYAGVVSLFMLHFFSLFSKGGCSLHVNIFICHVYG